MPHQNLYNSIFGKSGNDADAVSFLRDLTQEYPYFSVAHYFLLKETKPSDAEYAKTAAKTALHFNNPFLLNYLLNKKIQVKKLAPVVSLTPAPPPAAPQQEELIAEEKTEPTVTLNPVATTNTEENIAETKEELLFEPLHTTDYFASQGIKLREEVNPTDKLGKQLRSFTEWLKTMKKVHDGKSLPVSENIDIEVQRIAEKSNKEDEILTESMAEVYKEQGKPKKALEIYEKLSLLNPSKSAYFAAKIKLLKEN